MLLIVFDTDLLILELHAVFILSLTIEGLHVGGDLLHVAIASLELLLRHDVGFWHLSIQREVD